MKIASNVFSIIGIIANISIAVSYTFTSPAYCWIFWILSALSLGFGIAGCASASKSVGLGVCMLLFVNIFSGIFYLCWDGR